MTAISSRKRGKRRYFWEYSEQLTPAQQERMLRPSEWNRDTLPSNMYQKNGLHHGKNSSSWSQMAVCSLWHLQQPRSPPCQCWGVVFWPWKVEHCESVTQVSSAQGRWTHRRDFQCGFFQRSRDELRIVASKGSQWKSPEFKAFSVWYCKYWMGGLSGVCCWWLFLSVLPVLAGGREGSGLPNSGGLWYELRTSSEAQLSLSAPPSLFSPCECSTVKQLLLWE